MKVVLALALGALAYFGVRRLQKRRKAKPVARFDLAFLAARLKVDEEELRTFEPTYRTRTIDKRGPYRSNRDKRTLHVPEPATMELQRKILRRILRDLKVHPSARGFERGCSVPKNAAAHTRQAVVLKMDLVSFFENTKRARIQNYFLRIGWNTEAADVLTRITTYEGGLPQGAPTSPALSNRVNYGLDIRLASYASWRRGVYTRYADDITFSFPLDYPKRMRGVVQSVKQTAKFYGYEVHDKKKLRVLRRHHRQEVTGLVVNDGVRVPRKTRRWLRAVEHRINQGKEASLTPEQLAGWKAYVADVDRTRKTADLDLKERIVHALKQSGNSLTFAARNLDMPLAVLKRNMRLFELWDPKTRRS